jgi:hypothetical protein
MVVGLALGAAILSAMICVSCYGWVTLPSDARVPIHFGMRYNNFVAKRTGLILHSAVAALVYAIFIAAVEGSPGGPSATNTPPYIILPIMLLLLIVQAGAIRVARLRSG